jgi:RNA polymerase sigma-70 factor (ECF subfamily)
VNADDRQLIADCLRGRIEAFSVLVRRYQDRLFNAMVHYVNNAEDAQDVVQEAFISAYKALERFKGESQFFTWLYRIARNHATDLKRKKRVTHSLEVHLHEDAQPVDGSEATRPEGAVERSEEEALVRRALDQLSPEHRQVLVLNLLEGLKYEEIAEALQVPIGTIRSRIHRAKAELREILEREELGR